MTVLAPLLIFSILAQIEPGDPGRFNGYLLLAYGVMWLILIVYLFNLVSKQRNLQRDIRFMRQLLSDDEAEEQS
ncbi:MAG: CcmD family protein [Candidatus Promineifilaceae bacterium]|nr:CcmD family protein [Candidatus Promineifilaceae bacterium]